MGSSYNDEFHFCLDTTMLRYNRSFGCFAFKVGLFNFCTISGYN